MTGIEEARAIALFNPTGLATGFLQPVFAGPSGDNQSYVQIVRDTKRIARFEPVSWPERDCVLLDDPVEASVAGESIWSFRFADEPPIILPWSSFRETMQASLQERRLAEFPLLAFDIVDTLELADLMPDVYEAAYRRYLSMGNAAADNWRDRAILEPAIGRAIDSRGTSARFQKFDDPTSRFRARIHEKNLVVALPERLAGAEQLLSETYNRLLRDYPTIFPEVADVILKGTRPAVRSRAEKLPVRIVLAGRIAQARVDHDRWAARGIEVIAADHLNAVQSRFKHTTLTVITGAQTDWPMLIEAATRIENSNTVLFSLSTTMGTLLRDLEFQDASPFPTISFFAPFATSTAGGRDPVMPIAPLVVALRDEVKLRSAAIPVHTQHSLFLRETMGPREDATEFCCRLGARAIRTGAVLHGKARIYCQGEQGDDLHRAWARLLSPLFDIDHDDRGIRSSATRSALLMLVERVSEPTASGSTQMLRQGARILLQMRGWEIVQDDDDHLVLEDKQRKFNAAIVDQLSPPPLEERSADTPAFGRAALLVIHVNPKREQLLVGNIGQHFHVALEDISLMQPGSPWVWPVLRRQLLEMPGRPSLAALRLTSAVIAEAIRLGRVQTAFADVEWDEVRRLTSAKDCERFVEFHPRRIARKKAAVVIPEVAQSGDGSLTRAIITLEIDDDGPIVSASIDLS